MMRLEKVVERVSSEGGCYLARSSEDLIPP